MTVNANKFVGLIIEPQLNAKATFTLYRIVKRSVAESVPSRASVHTKNAAFELALVII